METPIEKSDTNPVQTETKPAKDEIEYRLDDPVIVVAIAKRDKALDKALAKFTKAAVVIWDKHLGNGAEQPPEVYIQSQKLYQAEVAPHWDKFLQEKDQIIKTCAEEIRKA